MVAVVVAVAVVVVVVVAFIGLSFIYYFHSLSLVLTAYLPYRNNILSLQLVEVFSRSVSWLGIDSIIRLVKSYDPQNTGMVRYVRITATLLATLQPAIIELASTFNRVRAKIRITDENKEDNELMGELIMVRFLHSLYEECSGGTEWKMVPSGPSEVHGTSNESKQLELQAIAEATPSASTSTSKIATATSTPGYTMKRVAVGMKLEDLPEMFSCCVSCVEDELFMDRKVQQMIEYFYSEAQKKSFLMQSDNTFDSLSPTNRVDIMTNNSRGGGSSSSTTISNSMLKYPLLKSSVVLSRISQEELIEALQLPQHKDFLREFIRQVRTFRKLAAPYIFKTSVSLDDSIEQFSTSTFS